MCQQKLHFGSYNHNEDSKWGEPVVTKTFKILVVLVTQVVAASGDRYHPVDLSLRVQTPNKIERTPGYWRQQASVGVAASLSAHGSAGKPRNVVLFLGDGMSLATLTAARIRFGQLNGLSGEQAELYFESFPTSGLVKTYCTNSQVGDSACTATAFMCGVKTNAGVIGLSAAVLRGDCAAAERSSNQLRSIAEWAIAEGLDVGIVTTTRVTHASPAAAYAKAADRRWESDTIVLSDGRNPKYCPDIAYQLVNDYPGKLFKVILGGGRKHFLPSDYKDQEGAQGKRTDGRNLIRDWQQDKSARRSVSRYIWNRDELMSVNRQLPEYLLGLFESDHMQYNLISNKSTEPTLSEMTETAIRMLRRNKKGFFLFVESGRIDHGHHGNRPNVALDETIQLSQAVARGAALLGDDTLVVVTADHGHSMNFNGYSERGHDILGRSNKHDSQGVPFMTLSYTNGPGARGHGVKMRQDVTHDPNYRQLGWRTHADFHMISSTHGGEDVVVFARGPRHALFSGLYEQSQLAHRIAWAMCIGPGRGACTDVARYGDNALADDNVHDSAPRIGEKSLLRCSLLLALFTYLISSTAS